MEKAFIRKKKSTIVLALLIIVGLSLLVASMTPISAIGIINNMPAIANPANFSTDLSASITNNTSGANTMVNQTAANQSALIPNPAGTGLSYADFNFNANSSQVAGMPLLYRMWRNAEWTMTMGRAFAGDMSYPLWILPTEYTPSAIEMHNWYQVSSAALNYTLPGTYLTPRFWSLGITAPNNPAVSALSRINIAGQIPSIPSGIINQIASNVSGNTSSTKVNNTLSLAGIGNLTTSLAG